MEVVYVPVADMTFSEFADRYGLTLRITGINEDDANYRASLVRDGQNAVSVRGSGLTARSAANNLRLKMSGKTVSVLDTLVSVPTLTKGDIDELVQAAISG